MNDQPTKGVAPSEIAVGVRELRAALATYLDRVSAGAGIVITRDGRPVARLTPPGEPSGPVHGLDELARLGLVERPQIEPSTGSTGPESTTATATRPLPVDVRVDRIVRQVRG